ncbi:MAG TPA: response regulator [Caulobacteraceae bacterium]|nr:response regulator [Caulobacteraceae bacterium]
MAGLDPKAWINLGQATVALVDGTELGMQILKQIFSGLGARSLRCFGTAAEALDFARHTELTLIVCDDTLPDMSGYDFVNKLRHAGMDPNSFTPVIIVSGHTRQKQVAAARDCGANFVVAKPMSAQTLLERVVWVAKDGRPFVEVGGYLGPDRRFKEVEAEAKRGRRRHDGRTAEADPASQAEPERGAA